MRKGKIIMTVTIGLACLILTSVIFLQFNTIKQTDITSLENMREEELRTEIANFKTKNEEVNKRRLEILETMEEYKNSENDETEAKKLLEQELMQYDDLLGKNDVSGDGIIVTLTDTRAQKISAEDLITLLNDLKSAGAEAISINDQRIVYDTYVVEINNTYMSVNGSGMVSPYSIKAIGNPTYLESSLGEKQYGYIDTKLTEGKDVTLERATNIMINKYDKSLEFEYIRGE